MSKFTPGPWGVELADNYDERFIAICGSNNNVIIWWSVPLDIFDKEFANANLIAAAPELFDALNAMVFAYENKDEDFPQDYEITALKKAEAAIIKAGGDDEKINFARTALRDAIERGQRDLLGIGHGGDYK